MPVKIIFSVLILPLMAACLEKPVLYKENNIAVSKNSIKTLCTTLERNLPDYSCTDFFNETYERKKEDEKIEIELKKTQLKLRYETTEENEELFDQYEEMLRELKDTSND